MAPSKRKPPARDRRLSESVLASGFDFLRFNPRNHKKQEHSQRDGFARGIVFAEFGYRHARAIDYGGFTDRKPARAGVWWRSGP